MKKIWIGLLAIVVIILSLIFIQYIFGFPIGQECGRWSAFGSFRQKSCECIGIMTGHCPIGSMCDGGTYGCIGTCRNCVCRNTTNMEIIPCD